MRYIFPNFQAMTDYRLSARMVFPALFTVWLCTGSLLTGCGGGDAGPQLDSNAVSLPDPVTYADFLAEFKVQQAPCVIPDDRIDPASTPVVGVDYLDTFVVGDERIFPPSENAALKFYTRIESDRPYDILCFIEFKIDGLHYHLATLDSNHKLIDRREIAFKLTGENFTHTKTARIDNQLNIAAESTREEIYVPRTEAEIRDQRNPVQRSTQTTNELITISREGKFVVRQAAERL